MKRLWIILASSIALILFGIALWIGCEVYHARSSNADGITSYGDYRELLPVPRAARQLTKDGDDYYAFFGPVNAPLALPSGPPAYVFDANGNLVDWTLDIGEDPRFSSTWSAHQGSEIDIDHFEPLLTRKKNTEHDGSGQPASRSGSK